MMVIIISVVFRLLLVLLLLLLPVPFVEPHGAVLHEILVEVERVEEHVRLVSALASEALEERLVVVLLQNRFVLRMGTLLDDLKSPVYLYIYSFHPS